MPDTVAALNGLLALRHDAVRAYLSVVERVRSEQLRAPLAGRLIAHERQASDLTAQVLRLGGMPRSRRDLRGPVIAGAAALGAWWSDLTALKALLRTEELAIRGYAEALQTPLDPETEALVHRGFREQAEVVAWLERVIEEREPRIGAD